MRKKNFLILFCLGYCLLMACQSEKNTAEHKVSKTSTPSSSITEVASEEDIIEFTSLASFPEDQASDCYCSLRLTTDEESEAPVFIFNMEAGPGVIGINGLTIMASRGASLSPQGGTYTSYLHETDQLRIQTSLTQEDGTIYTGVIKVTHKVTGLKSEVSVIGSCLC